MPRTFGYVRSIKARRATRARAAAHAYGSDQSHSLRRSIWCPPPISQHPMKSTPARIRFAGTSSLLFPSSRFYPKLSSPCRIWASFFALVQLMSLKSLRRTWLWTVILVRAVAPPDATSTV